MEQKEGVVFFLKLLIFPIEKEIHINWKEHFVVFFFYWLPQKVWRIFLIIFFPQLLGFFKKIYQNTRERARFFPFLFYYYFFLNKGQGLSFPRGLFLVPWLLCGMYIMCAYSEDFFSSYGFPYFKRKLSIVLCRQIDWRLPEDVDVVQ